MATRTSKPRIGPSGIPIPTNNEWGIPAEKTSAINRPKTREEILWSEYAIQPNLPLRTKVEQLMLLWRLPAVAIARLLDINQSQAQEEIEALNEEWLALGKPLDEETRQIVRGRMIAELVRLKAELESANAGNPDSRLLALKLQVIDKLTKLQGLDLDKRETTIEDEVVNPIGDAIDSLTEERRAELLARLNNNSLK
jgi:hypothetical protein